MTCSVKFVLQANIHAHRQQQPVREQSAVIIYLYLYSTTVCSSQVFFRIKYSSKHEQTAQTESDFVSSAEALSEIPPNDSKHRAKQRNDTVHLLGQHRVAHEASAGGSKDRRRRRGKALVTWALLLQTKVRYLCGRSRSNLHTTMPLSGDYTVRAQPRRRCSDDKEEPLFLRKTFEMISSCDESLASWTSSGETFVVKDPGMFAETVIPRYFKREYCCTSEHTALADASRKKQIKLNSWYVWPSLTTLG